MKKSFLTKFVADLTKEKAQFVLSMQFNGEYCSKNTGETIAVSPRFVHMLVLTNEQYVTVWTHISDTLKHINKLTIRDWKYQSCNNSLRNSRSLQWVTDHLDNMRAQLRRKAQDAGIPITKEEIQASVDITPCQTFCKDVKLKKVSQKQISIKVLT